MGEGKVNVGLSWGDGTIVVVPMGMPVRSPSSWMVSSPPLPPWRRTTHAP